MATLYKYRIYCTTDSKYVEGWFDSDPSVCPENNSHAIDQSKTRVVEIRESDTVKIKEETVSTGGHYRARTERMDIPPSSTGVTDITIPYDISALDTFFMTTSENEGDILKMTVSPETIVGAITVDVSISDTVISVSPTVIANIALGYTVSLFDGVTINELGHVLSIDTILDTITIETATTASFVAASPTYVRMSVPFIEDFEIGPAGRYRLGSSKIGGSHIPANTIVRVEYENKSVSVAKKFVPISEFLY